MLSLTKKSDAQPLAAPQWHTNFRDFERLPDTKVVRTTFFINTAAIAVAIGMLLWLGYREYSIRNIAEQVTAANRQIESNKKQNAEALKLSKAFVEESRKIEEAAAFTKVPITPVVFLGLIGASLPKDNAIDSVDIRISDPKNLMFQLRGKVAGSPDLASGITSSYVDTLRADPELKKIFDPITLNRLDRDSAGGFMVFEITLTIKK
jgi:hypothetical protein